VASLLGFGAYVPERILSNDELAARLGCTPDWIFQVSGIRERRVAAENQSVADLGFAAAKECLELSGIPPNEIGQIMVASGSSERRFPGPSTNIARRLGIVGTPCLDVPIASAGSLFALSLASRLAGELGPILVIAAEKMSAVALKEPLDKNISILFGDGAGACLVAPQAGEFHVIGSVLHSDGAYVDDLYLDADGRLTMNGLSVIMQASRKLPAGIAELLRKHSVNASEVQAFLMHQANQNLMVRVAKALDVPSERFYSNVAQYGNTSSASMLIAAAEYLRGRTIPAGSKICFAAFGAGFHWGALLAEKT
jgi:3-oxoacyl-[acyl-carrier-protein] synthase III